MGIDWRNRRRKSTPRASVSARDDRAAFDRNIPTVLWPVTQLPGSSALERAKRRVCRKRPGSHCGCHERGPSRRERRSRRGDRCRDHRLGADTLPNRTRDERPDVRGDFSTRRGAPVANGRRSRAGVGSPAAAILPVGGGADGCCGDHRSSDSGGRPPAAVGVRRRPAAASAAVAARSLHDGPALPAGQTAGARRAADGPATVRRERPGCAGTDVRLGGGRPIPRAAVRRAVRVRPRADARRALAGTGARKSRHRTKRPAGGRETRPRGPRAATDRLLRGRTGDSSAGALRAVRRPRGPRDARGDDPARVRRGGLGPSKRARGRGTSRKS